METTPFYPYRSAPAREACCRYLDELAAREWPLQSEKRMIPTTFGQTFVRISGPPDAPVLVLLHGAGATSLMWAPNIEALSHDFRTVAVDQVGEFGKSTAGKLIRSLDDQMMWLDELTTALSPVRRISLAGMSYGGALAAQYALHAPKRLDRLVLLAPGATVLRPPLQFWLRLAVLAAERRKGLHRFFRWIFPVMARTRPQWVDATVEQLSLNMQNVVRHKVPMPPVLTDAQWARMHTPALFLAGEHEVIYSAASAVSRLKRVAPGVVAEVIPAAGHDLTFSQTALVNSKMLRFLTGR